MEIHSHDEAAIDAERRECWARFRGVAMAAVAGEYEPARDYLAAITERYGGEVGAQARRELWAFVRARSLDARSEAVAAALNDPRPDAPSSE